MKKFPYKKDLLHSTIDYKRLIELQSAGYEFFQDSFDEHKPISKEVVKVKKRDTRVLGTPREYRGESND